MRKIAIAVSALLFAACGGASKNPESATKSVDEEAPKEKQPNSEGNAAAKDDKSEDAAGPAAIPSDCAKKQDDVCLPDPKFVKKLCAAEYPGVALYMFAKGSPWTRAFLKGKTQAWNASGGASENAELEFDEEVLVLVLRKAAPGGIQVGSGVGYDVLRWNGTCVSLEGGEITMKRPPAPKSAKVEFKSLDDKLKDMLRGDKRVDDAFKARRTECQAASMGQVSAKCVKADAKLSESIVAYVRDGGSVPIPSKLPE